MAHTFHVTSNKNDETAHRPYGTRHHASEEQNVATYRDNIGHFKEMKIKVNLQRNHTKVEHLTISIYK